MKTRILFLLGLIFALALAACGPAVPAQPTTPGGAIYVDSAGLMVMESYPVQVRLWLAGNLPTPCHSLEYQVAAPDAQNRIHVTAYSTADPAAMCAQVLQPFEESIAIPMEGTADGTYSVWLNGELVGEFSYPG